MIKRPFVSEYLKNNVRSKQPNNNVYNSPLLSTGLKKGLNPYFSFNNENYENSSELYLYGKLDTSNDLSRKLYDKGS